MRLLINRLIETDHIQSKEQFELELGEWLLKKGFTSIQDHSTILPHNLSSPVKAGNGTAVFHSNYSIDQTDLISNRRYFLSRTWDKSLPIMTLFGMNPSVAESCSNDPTIEFMIKVARYNGYGSLYVINTSPYIKRAETKRQDFVIDDEHWEYIKYAVGEADLVVLAWGENGQKYGVPTLTSHFPLRTLLAGNSEKLRVFDLRYKFNEKIP
ncbi:hypothetical protein CJ195_16135 [Bacillus sp. UMB0899]|nr:hypothetical protein CJ195_16135 [Bacillus sp. UMB0899]